jgi:hypothetical protein
MSCPVQQKQQSKPRQQARRVSYVYVSSPVVSRVVYTRPVAERVIVQSASDDIVLVRPAQPAYYVASPSYVLVNEAPIVSSIDSSVIAWSWW